MFLCPGYAIIGQGNIDQQGRRLHSLRHQEALQRRRSPSEWIQSLSESHFRRAKEIRIEEPHEAHNVLAEALARRSRSVGGDDLHVPGNVVTRISA